MALPECPMPASLREQRLWQPLAHSESASVLAASECSGLGCSVCTSLPFPPNLPGLLLPPLHGGGGRRPSCGVLGGMRSCGAHAAPGMNREPQHLPLLSMPCRSSGVGPVPAMKRGPGCLPQMSGVLLPLLASVYPAPLGEFSWDLLISGRSLTAGRTQNLPGAPGNG